METVTTKELDVIDAAQRAINRHGDADVHTVAAAVLDEQGLIHVGVNLHHFTGGPCAELSVLAAARAAGARHPQVIVAVGDDGRGVLSPCGRDRQVFVDYYPYLRVIVPTPEGLRVVGASELLPYSYLRRTEPDIQRLRFRDTYLDAVRAGTKRSTIRFREPVQTGPALLVFERTEPVSLPARIVSTLAKRVGEITEEEALAGGCACVADVLPGLRHYYPTLRVADEVVLVGFELIE